MPSVRYTVAFPHDDRPTVLPGETNAVLASTCAEYDIGQGGVTFEEIDPDDVAALITCPVGAEVFVESPDPEDALDTTSEATSAATRIWWRGVVEG